MSLASRLRSPLPKGFTQDTYLLFITRMVRLFGYGFLSVVLILYLAERGLAETQIGLLLTLTLIGDTALSLLITTNADRVGRQNMLIVGAGLMVLAGVLFAITGDFLLLLIAATIGVISPSGNEIGPFLSIEQAALSQAIAAKQRTHVFAWYNLVGSFATALGALASGTFTQVLQSHGMIPLDSYRAVVIGYSIIGFILILLFWSLSPAIEVPPDAKTPQTHTLFQPGLGLHGSRQVVFKLAALFSLDAFAGGFVVQSIVAYWFHLRFGVEPAVLGQIFFAANILAGISALSAARVANRIGLVNTMVFTHLPSNILLMLVPLMPNLPLAITLLLLRFSISQMDVPTRQSYTMAVVEASERSAASGVTGIARTLGASFAPIFVGPLLNNPALLGLPFVIAGSLKVVYDLLLYRSFRALRPVEETPSLETSPASNKSQG